MKIDNKSKKKKIDKNEEKIQYSQFYDLDKKEKSLILEMRKYIKNYE